MQDKANKKDSELLEVIRTFWPLVLFIFGAVVFMIRAETVSPTAFNSLKERMALVEERVPTRRTMLRIEKNQAVMLSQLQRLNLYTDSMIRRLTIMDEKEKR